MNRRWHIAKVRHYIEELGMEVVIDPAKSFDVAMYWSFNRTQQPLDNVLKDMIKQGIKIINIGCWDITKSKNEEVMKRVFGYNTIVDPTKESEFCEKSEQQGRHSTTIMNKFEGYRDGYIYVKLIDNIVDGKAESYRVFVTGGKFILFYKKRLPIEKRFARTGGATIELFTEGTQVFTQEELSKIHAYCHEYPVDYTELDVLRDSDGKIYIVDNNNMPGMSGKMKTRLVEEGYFDMLCDEFYKMCERHKI